ncbi:putative plant SNARE 11 [Nymphaea thermarum]|nr:putative plant SNARE 11 [Nymphaea thermarum]
MNRIVNELDSIHFSIKKASQLVKEIGRQGKKRGTTGFQLVGKTSSSSHPQTEQNHFNPVTNDHFQKLESRII